MADNVSHDLRSRRFWKAFERRLELSLAFRHIETGDIARVQDAANSSPTDAIRPGAKAQADIERVFGAWGLPTEVRTWAQLRGNQRYLEQLFGLLDLRNVGYRSDPAAWVDFIEGHYPELLPVMIGFLGGDRSGLAHLHAERGTFAANAAAYAPEYDDLTEGAP